MDRIIGIAVAAFFIYVLYMLFTTTVRAQKNFILRLRRELNGSGSGPYIEFSLTELQFELLLFEGGGGAHGGHTGTRFPPRMELSCKTIAKPTFYLTNEGLFEKIAKLFGLLEEFEIGASTFDSTFIIRVDDKCFAETLFDKAEVQSALLQLHGLGFTTVVHKEKKLSAQMIPFEIRDTITGEMIRDAAKNLAKVRKHLDSSNR